VTFDEVVAIACELPGVEDVRIEGCEALGGDPGALAELHAVGVRMLSLTWNLTNVFASGTADPDGAGSLGRPESEFTYDAVGNRTAIGAGNPFTGTAPKGSTST